MLKYTFAFTLVTVSFSRVVSGADQPVPVPVWQDDTGSIRAHGERFESWSAYFGSDTFRTTGGRCQFVSNPPATDGGDPSDCTYTLTNPDAAYDPSVGRFRIPVVVHVIRNNTSIYHNTGGSREIDLGFRDMDPEPGTNFYYLRVQQENRQTAWSSPIWVNLVQ